MTDTPTTNGICGTSLVASDLAAYDTSPDGRLYLDELPAEKLACLGDRYLRTDDKEVRDRFREAMSNGLWEALQQRFQAMADTDPPAGVPAERLESILGLEFPASTLHWNVGTEYNHEEEAESSSAYATAKALDTVLTYGAATALLPFGRWKWIGSLRGDFGVNVERQLVTEDGETDTTEYRYVHTKLTPSSVFLTRDDQFSISTDAAWAHYFDPPPDHFVDDLLVNGAAELRKIPLGGHPVSIEGSVNYLYNRAMPPATSLGFYTIRTDTLTVNASTTYGLSPIGLLLDYTFIQNDSAQHYVEKASSAHEASGLVQYSASESTYVRVGAGGGARTSHYTIIAAAPTTGDSASAHGRLEGQAQLHPRVRLQGSASVTAEKGEGTFVGWYPAWDAALTLHLSPPGWTISLTGTYEGSDIELNEVQETHNVIVNGEIVYRPVEWVKLTNQLEATIENVAGYEEHTFRRGKAKVAIAINVPGWKPLWVGAYGGGLLYQYAGDGFLVEGHAWWAGLFVDITK